MEKVLIFGDVHCPFESKRGVDILLQVAKHWRPDHIACVGDLMDCFSISTHSKDPARRECLQDEVARAGEILDAIDAEGGEGKRLFIEGNHENRIERYIRDKAPELYGLVSLPQILELKARGWQHTPYRKHTKLGKLYLTHDLGFAGRYAAHRTLDAIQHSVVFGHTHRLSLLVEGNVVGDSRVAASFGWLGDIDQIDYMHRAKAQKDWALGFGLAYLDPSSGYVQLTPIPLLPRGKGLTCTVEGKVFNA